MAEISCFPKWTGTPHSDRSALRCRRLGRAFDNFHCVFSWISNHRLTYSNELSNNHREINRSVMRISWTTDPMTRKTRKMNMKSPIVRTPRLFSSAQIESDMGEGLEQYDSIEIGSKLRTFSNWSAHLPELIELYLIRLPSAEEEGLSRQALRPVVNNAKECRDRTDLLDLN